MDLILSTHHFILHGMKNLATCFYCIALPQKIANIPLILFAKNLCRICCIHLNS